MIAALLLMVSIDSTGPAVVDTSDALERVERWVDTARYEYLEPSEDEVNGWRNDERRYSRGEKGRLQIHPTLYPSPLFVRPFEA